MNLSGSFANASYIFEPIIKLTAMVHFRWCAVPQGKPETIRLLPPGHRVQEKCICGELEFWPPQHD